MTGVKGVRATAPQTTQSSGWSKAGKVSLVAFGMLAAVGGALALHHFAGMSTGGACAVGGGALGVEGIGVAIKCVCDHRSAKKAEAEKKAEKKARKDARIEARRVELNARVDELKGQSSLEDADRLEGFRCAILCGRTDDAKSFLRRDMNFDSIEPHEWRLYFTGHAQNARTQKVAYDSNEQAFKNNFGTVVQKGRTVTNELSETTQKNIDEGRRLLKSRPHRSRSSDTPPSVAGPVLTSQEMLGGQGMM